MRFDAHLCDRDPLDYYIEPCWVSDRLFKVEAFDGAIVDPACGSGRIVASAIKAGHIASGGDIVNRGPLCETVADFLREPPIGTPNIICNPPYRLVRKLAEQALRIASRKMAFLLPLKWVCGDDRSRWLETTPPARVWFLTPRPSMPPGAVIEAGEKPGGRKEDFCWFVFEHGHKGSWTADG